MPGSEGTTIPFVGIGSWGDCDRFVAVQFDSGAKLDILWKSLEMMTPAKLPSPKQWKDFKERKLRYA